MPHPEFLRDKTLSFIDLRCSRDATDGKQLQDGWSSYRHHYDDVTIRLMGPPIASLQPSGSKWRKTSEDADSDRHRHACEKPAVYAWLERFVISRLTVTRRSSVCGACQAGFLPVRIGW
jgi:hypothetical protein